MTQTTQWDILHKNYSKEDWINIPNIFAEEVVKHLPKHGSILCLGDGQGQDGRYFASMGYEVLSTDISEEALRINKEKAKEAGLLNLKVDKLDLTQKFPLTDNAFDVVYSHLSVHYFSTEITKIIFEEIQRVLKPGGILCLLVNSVNDPEFNTGKRLEQELFEIDGKIKRFMSIFSMDYFARDFTVILLDDLGRTRKDEKKRVQNLVRFIGSNYPRRVSNYALPFAAAIIERAGDAESEILLQTRWRPNAPWNYHQFLEIPAGAMDKSYESIEELIQREVRDETGLEIEILNFEKSETFETPLGASYSFKPFIGSQQLKGGLPWVGFTFICRVTGGREKEQENETRNIRWVKKSKLRHMVEEHPEKFFSLHLGALRKYLNQEQ